MSLNVSLQLFNNNDIPVTLDFILCLVLINKFVYVNEVTIVPAKPLVIGMY